MSSQNDYSTTEHLLAKALQRFGTKRCKHSQTTHVQHVSQDEVLGLISFTCYQCDNCGTKTQKPVTPDELAQATNLPWLDVAMYEQATTEKLPNESINKALEFFGMAMR